MVVLKTITISSLPKSGKTIVVAGRGANDIGMQSGGLGKFSWQGGMGETTKGTTILDAIKSSVDPGTVVEYSIDGKDLQGSA
ncbi:hypothetical protein CM15mP37_12690 [bacterium]|nr:MAG: hypothetical protein CM15mP37_12690 [bacterium]